MTPDDSVSMPDTAPQTDAALLAALKGRDKAALALIFERYAPRIHRHALSVMGDPQVADGVVQETFLALLTHLDQFEGRASLGTWLYRVAHNECLGRLRRERPQADLDSLDERLDAAALMPTHFGGWALRPEEALADREMSEQLTAAIEALPLTLKSVFLLRDVEGLSTHEVAQIMSLTEAAVKVRLHRARLALREALAAYFEEYTR